MPDSVGSIEQLLTASDKLQESIFDILADGDESLQVSSNVLAGVQLCLLSIEHASGLRTPVAALQPSSALCLLRPQYEALVRGAWVVWAAEERDIERLSAPLTLAGEAAAAKLPMLGKMLEQVRGRAPDALVDQLAGFKDASVGALNSFVHSGIHAVTRHATGYPEHLVQQVVRQSNALMSMAGMLLALLGGRQEAVTTMRAIQRPFAHCLPELLTPTS